MEAYPTYRAASSREASPWLPWKFFRARVPHSPVSLDKPKREIHSSAEVPQLVIRQLLKSVVSRKLEEPAIVESCPEDNFLTEYLANHALTSLPPGEVIHTISLPPVAATPYRATPVSHRRVLSSCVPDRGDFLDDLFQETKAKPRTVVTSLGHRRPKALSIVPVRMEICGSRMATPLTDLSAFTKTSFSPVRRPGNRDSSSSPIRIPQPRPHRRFESLDATTQSIKPHPLYAEWSCDSLSSSGHMPPITRNPN